MVTFGLSLGLRVVAEGVEDAETLDILAALNCDLAQGYLISRPLQPAAMTLWLNTIHQADSAERPSLAPQSPRPVARSAAPPPFAPSR